MTITKQSNGGNLTLALEGRLDTGTAPQLEAELNALCAAGTISKETFEGALRDQSGVKNPASSRPASPNIHSAPFPPPPSRGGGLPLK